MSLIKHLLERPFDQSITSKYTAINRLIYLAAATLVLGMSGIAGAQDKPPVGLLCDQQFALCTSANCVPAPGDPKVALCTCAVWDGKGGTTGVASCDAVKPSTDANGWRTVYSYF